MYSDPAVVRTRRLCFPRAIVATESGIEQGRIVGEASCRLAVYSELLSTK